MGHEVFEHEASPAPVGDYDFSDCYRVPVMESPVSLAHPFREEEWRQAVGFAGFSYCGNLARRDARAYIAATHSCLYFAVITETLPGGEPRALVTEHSPDQLVWDDSVEIWVDPWPGEDTGVSFQMMFNAKGVDGYTAHTRGKARTEDYYDWSGNCRTAHFRVDGAWQALVEAPLASFCPDRPVTKGKWGINICRNWKDPWAFSSLGNRGYAPADDIIFAFSPDAAALHVRHETDPFTSTLHAILRVDNPCAFERRLSGQFYLLRDKMPEATSQEDMKIPPGGHREVVFRLEDTVSDHFELFAMVRDEEGTIVYSRFYRWSPDAEPRWESQQHPAPPLDFRFAYYPSRNRLRVQADATALDKGARLERMDFAVREVDSTGVAVAAFSLGAFDFRDGLAETSIDLPPLRGKYEIAAEGKGEGVTAEPIIKHFERNVFPWEKEGLGTSRKVYPPFTPIRVEGRSLHTVLKEYVLGDSGLLDVVRTDDQQRLGFQDILAGAMTYTAVVDGLDVFPEACRLRITEAADDRAAGVAAFRLGSIEAVNAWSLEYDGMFKVELTLTPSSSSAPRLDRLELDIPLHADRARFMHAMVDGLRNSIFTAEVPEGRGTVWSSSKLQAVSMPSKFCGYIFVGDARRGISWFAENDRGWAWDPASPNCSLVRDGARLILRVHLGNRAVALSGPRTLVFGVQAAPVKPRLPGWRHRWLTECWRVVGTDIHWFGLGWCSSLYPAGHDLELWRAIARDNRGELDSEGREEALDRARTYFRPFGPRTMEEFEQKAAPNLGTYAGRKMIFYYNRASFAAAGEFQTFMDEWCLNEYNDYRGSGSRGLINIVPTDSYIDFALHWYARSFETAGNRGIYLDNNFLTACSNSEMTCAYRGDDGKIVPSNGLWALRELGKRQFVLMNERGMEPLTMVHMTSVQILPINAFYTIQYDWEWRFSEGDVQNRFSLPYLLSVSNGEHLGAWPVVLHEQGRCAHDPWTLRTFLAVTLVHELIVDPYVWDLYPVPEGDTPENRLMETFRGPVTRITLCPDVQVYRYWDARPQPLRAGLADILAIVYCRKGVEAVAVLASFRDVDAETTVTLDAAAMGFVGEVAVTDVETGVTALFPDAGLRVRIRKHDLLELRFTSYLLTSSGLNH